MKTYQITQEQLEKIEHYKRMFEFHADNIETLCNSEKDDVVYGFELGKLHSHLRECFSGMYRLEEEIRSSNFDENKSTIEKNN